MLIHMKKTWIGWGRLMRRTARSYLMPSNLLVSLFGGGAPKFRTFRIAVLPYFRSISSFYFHRSLSIVIADGYISRLFCVQGGFYA